MPTAADWARDSSRDNAKQTQELRVQLTALQQRVAELELQVKRALALALEDRK